MIRTEWRKKRKSEKKKMKKTMWIFQIFICFNYKFWCHSLHINFQKPKIVWTLSMTWYINSNVCLYKNKIRQKKRRTSKEIVSTKSTIKSYCVLIFTLNTAVMNSERRPNNKCSWYLKHGLVKRMKSKKKI